jgi:hypothetical protein
LSDKRENITQQGESTNCWQKEFDKMVEIRDRFVATLAARDKRIEKLEKALHRIGYEPFGKADASHDEVLEAITQFARTALTSSASPRVTRHGEALRELIKLWRHHPKELHNWDSADEIYDDCANELEAALARTEDGGGE